ncbi:SDR family oxidoreductase [Marinimicrobium alkaliphilum]|uniref:SDR family oxidoreductase n=1 Tax=Marinimicrobium alkaliphilum TaxID=2202654 RepID=UPI000DBA47A5|nr:SDR family oxidoreductase [Marinimicrobium alkaliphilum]
MTTLIIGAHGQIGQLLVKELADHHQKPKAMVRNKQQAEAVRSLGADPVIADLEADFAHAFEGCDKVVFTAGSGAKTGPDKTILVDLWGAIKAVDIAKAKGIKQFVMVSSRGAEDPEAGPTKIKHYTVCKKLADDHLLASGVPYTILRPGRLTDDDATGRVRSQWPDNADDQWISRADVALAIEHCLDSPGTLGKVYPLFHGEQPISACLG